MSARLNITRLELSWATSRGRDTYGYNIARLDDTNTRQRYRCMGGGYDMTGTVFGQWLQDAHQPRLLAIKDRASHIRTAVEYVSKGGESKLYGMTYHEKGDKVTLDGGCGISCMVDIAKACGLDVQWMHNRRGHTTGFLVSFTEE